MKSVATLIRDSPNFRSVFPECRPARGRSWTDHKLHVERPPGVTDPNPSLHARGIFTVGIGGRAEYMIFDDVVDQRNALDHPQDRQRVIELFDSTWMSRFQGFSGSAVAIGTVWHRDDLYCAHLMKNPRWVTLRQRIGDGLDVIEQEVWNVPTGLTYPGVVDAGERALAQ